MVHDKSLNHYHKALSHISQLPYKMLTINGAQNMSDFVLHELCQEDCFNVNKAAYFVDNPDFNCFKGIAGFDKNQSFASDILWQAPADFNKHMSKSEFHNKVRTILRPSFKHTRNHDAQMVQELAHDLDMKSPHFCSWPTKHDNHALFLYEVNEMAEDLPRECIMHGVCLLSFCPIY